ncbi:MAG: 3-deoxy-manno-octulosonate cytidylyltransferase [bacterium]
MYKVIGIIPARFGSVRLPGKPLIEIAGKSIIQYVYEKARASCLLNDCLIATDDQRIFDKVKEFGGKVVLTRLNCQSGTDRVAEASLNIESDVIINIQGDEPLIFSEMIDELISIFLEDSFVEMASLRTKILDSEEINNPNVVKVVVDKNDYALYFSRYPIPYLRDENDEKTIYKHIGIYGYKKDFLLKISSFTPTFLEQMEKLEQLRVLENGYKIKVKETNFSSIGIDTKEDLEKVKKIMLSNSFSLNQ